MHKRYLIFSLLHFSKNYLHYKFLSSRKIIASVILFCRDSCRNFSRVVLVLSVLLILAIYYLSVNAKTKQVHNMNGKSRSVKSIPQDITKNKLIMKISSGITVSSKKLRRNQTTLIHDEPTLLPGSDCVPNVIHLIWFYKPRTQFKFHQLISILSVMTIQKPETVYFWYNFKPRGKWWNFIKAKAKEVNISIHMKILRPPKEIGGKEILRLEHASDYSRLKILKQFGGIYMDLDVVILKSLRPLMCYEMTMGQETEVKVNNGIILAIPGARFIDYWLDVYHLNFNPNIFDFNSVKTAYSLWQKHSSLLHIEPRSMNHPNWRPNEIKYIYTQNMSYNWKNNYCLHLWYRTQKREHDPTTIKTINSTLGQVFRYIWYGSSKLIM